MLTRCFSPKMIPDEGPSGGIKADGAASDTIAARKAELRRESLRRRAAMSPAEQHAAALALQPHLLGFLRRRCDTAGRHLHVAVFAPFRGELNIGLDWPAVLELPLQLYFPRVAIEHEPHRLEMVPLPPGCQPDDWLRPGHFGVPEPPPSETAEARSRAGESVDPSQSAAGTPLDLVLLPGLVFDRYGGRIGWGKAYYDRFLASCRPRPATAGIGYDFQVLDQELPLQPHDVRLDWLITPSGISRTDPVQVR